MGDTSNQLAIKAFAAQFSPPLNVTPVGAIGGNPARDGWMCALHDPETEIGLSAFAWGRGHFKAFIEAVGTGRDAVAFGKFFALGMSCAARVLAGADAIQTEGSGIIHQPTEKSPSPAGEPKSQDLEAPNATEQVSSPETPICEHDFRANAAGAGTICRKCGVRGPKLPLAIEMPHDNVELAKQLAEQEANFAAEPRPA